VLCGRSHAGAGEIKTCLLERCQSLADLRIIDALGTQRLACLLQRGLRALHLAEWQLLYRGQCQVPA
jgi:hypothetical protein